MKGFKIIKQNLEQHNLDDDTDVLRSCICQDLDSNWKFCIYQKFDKDVYIAEWNPLFGIRDPFKAPDVYAVLLLNL